MLGKIPSATSCSASLYRAAQIITIATCSVSLKQPGCLCHSYILVNINGVNEEAIYMKIFITIPAIILCASLAGCNSYGPYDAGPRSCIVQDHHGRTWAASGHRACRHAKHKCRRWHKRRGMRHWSCNRV